MNLVHFENNHNIPDVFWNFLNSSGPVDNGNGQITNERLINPWNYASGLPISEPYWAQGEDQRCGQGRHDPGLRASCTNLCTHQ